MSQELFANNASTTLAGIIGPSTTTITLATGTGDDFPVLSGGDYFTATIFAAGNTTGVPNEIVKVTARTGDTVTVVRGQQGTTASSWAVGDTFANYPTAAWYNAATTSAAVQSQSGNSAVDTGTANAAIVALSPAPSALSNLLYSPIRVLKMAQPNTGAMTINVNSFGIKAVTLNGNALIAGQLPANQVFEVVWDGTSFELISPPAVIPNATLAAMAAMTFKGNLTGISGQPADNDIASVLSALGFAGQSLTSNGYYHFPNGLIIQWGGATQAGGTGATSITFPIAFPNAGLVAFATNAATSPPTAFHGCQGPSSTGMTVWSSTSSGVAAPSGVSFGWMAIGF